MSEQIKVVLVDDHSLCRRGLTELLTLRYDINVVGATAHVKELTQLLRDQQPDLLVMDLRMEPMDGFGVLAQIRKEGFETPVVILSMSDSEADLAAALRAGVRGYLLKDMAPDEMVVAPAMTVKMIGILQHGQRGKENKSSMSLLTEREREILQLLSRAESNKAIAQTLGISNDTVKQHVRHILTKLHLTSRVEAAVLYAVEQKSMESR
jgi:two-component system, NarL family, nitrate/nitrite response regulator NarL